MDNLSFKGGKSSLLSMRGFPELPPTFTTGQARAAGVHPRDLYAARDDGGLVELSRGVLSGPATRPPSAGSTYACRPASNPADTSRPGPANPTSRPARLARLAGDAPGAPRIRRPGRDRRLPAQQLDVATGTLAAALRDRGQQPICVRRLPRRCAAGLLVLTLRGGRVSAMTRFLDTAALNGRYYEL